MFCSLSIAAAVKHNQLGRTFPAEELSETFVTKLFAKTSAGKVSVAGTKRLQMDNQHLPAIFVRMKSNQGHFLIQSANQLGMSRRTFSAALAAVSYASLVPAGTTMASTLAPPNKPRLEDHLQSVLRHIGSDACIAAADQLAQRPVGAGKLTLHLRSADITMDGASRIADAFASLDQSELARLGSFSLSYNEIGDGGAFALAAALPETLGEMGLVGCSIGDHGGEAILNWAKRASGLRMICIEGNAMSAEMRDRFLDLRRTSPGMAVYV